MKEAHSLLPDVQNPELSMIEECRCGAKIAGGLNRQRLELSLRPNRHSATLPVNSKEASWPFVQAVELRSRMVQPARSVRPARCPAPSQCRRGQAWGVIVF